MSLPTYIAFTQGTYASGVFSGTAPGATKVGDLMVVVWEGSAAVASGIGSASQGWYRVSASARAGDTVSAAIFAKVATVAGTANTYQISNVGSGNNGVNGCHVWRSTTGGPWGISGAVGYDSTLDLIYRTKAGSVNPTKVDDVWLAATTMDGNASTNFGSETMSIAGAPLSVQPQSDGAQWTRWQQGGTRGGKVTRAHALAAANDASGNLLYSFTYTFQNCSGVSAFARFRQLAPGFAGADPDSDATLYGDGSVALSSGGGTGGSVSTTTTTGGTGTGSSSSSATILGTSTAKWLASSDWAEIAFVLLFEGYDLAYCTHSDVAGLQAAWASATGGRWTQMKGGLDLVGEIAQECRVFNAQINPTAMSFTLLDYDDTLIGTMFADASTAASTDYLAASIDADDKTITAVDHFTAIQSGVILYIGTEAISGATKFSSNDGYGVSTSYFLCADNSRGAYSLYGNYRGGQSPQFGQAHTVDSATGDKPKISDRPLKWINRNVGLYLCHRVNGVWSAGLPGTSTTDAELLWTGPIKSYRDLGDARVELNCIDVLDRLKTTLGATAFTATLTEGLVIRDVYTEFWITGTVDDTAVLTTPIEYPIGGAGVSSWTGVGERLTHDEVAGRITVFMAELIGANPGVYVPANVTVALYRGTEGKYVIDVRRSSPSAVLFYKFRLWLPHAIWNLLGWDPVAAPQYRTGTSINSTLEALEIYLAPGQAQGTATAPELPQRHLEHFVRPDGTSGRTVIDVTGVVNGTTYVVQPSVPTSSPPGTEAFFLIGGKQIVAVQQVTATTFYFLDDMTGKFGGDPADLAKLIGTTRDDSAAETSIQQVWIESGTIGEIFLRLLSSTGTAGYNHPTYDVYPSWLGAGIPWGLLDWSSILGMGGDQ